jgi:thiol:disulfide interchange protein
MTIFRYQRVIWMMGVVLVALTPFFVSAQTTPPSPVTFSVSDVPTTVKAGEVFTVKIRAEIEDKWHLYSIEPVEDGPIPTSFKLLSENLYLAGEVLETEPEINYDPNFDLDIGWHSTSAEFSIPLAFASDVQGNSAVAVQVRYMVCDDRMCLPPTNLTLTASINVNGVAETPFVPLITDQPINRSTDQAINESTWYSFIWLAITAGLAALLTPCVFPMIPLTVSFFSKDTVTRKKAISNALMFGLSIIATFTLLGILLALLIGASGANQFAANPWVNLFIGLVFVLFALSLLGLFELQLPYQLTNWLNKRSLENNGILGILFMGLTISAVSFSCTAPFVGAILAATAQGEWFYPILGMLAFSAAFASPFILFAMFPKGLQALPKSGSWMNSVKIILGLIELGAAFKFLSNADLVWQWGLISRPMTIAVWIVLAFMAGFYLLGKIRFEHGSESAPTSSLRSIIAIPFLAFALYLMPGLFGSNLGIWDAWLPPKSVLDVGIVGSTGQPSSADEGWSKDYDQSVATASSEGKPIFIDFTGYTCTNCRAMESNVFPLKEVVERFNRFEKVKLYTDDGEVGPDHQKFQFQLTGTVALPTYAIVDPETGALLEVLSGYIEKERFVEFLDRGLQRYEQVKP